MSLAPCRWIKLGLLIANQEAQDPHACPYGYIATILWPSAPLVACSPRPAATRENSQSDSFTEGKKGLASASVSDRPTWGGSGLIDHEAESHMARGNDFSDDTNDQNGQSSKERVRVIGSREPCQELSCTVSKCFKWVSTHVGRFLLRLRFPSSSHVPPHSPAEKQIEVYTADFHRSTFLCKIMFNKSY